MTKYYGNIATGEVRCDASNSCIGMTLKASVERAVKTQVRFVGMDGMYELLTDADVIEMRDAMLQDCGVGFVCTHEMHAALTSPCAIESVC